MSKKMIFVQAMCLCVILLSCLSIGMGSWLETNNLLYLSSPSVSHQLSTFKIDLVQKANASSKAYLSFGLWRYCLYDITNDFYKCSSIKLNLDIDTYTTMNILIDGLNKQQLPTPSSVSYVRIVPLIIANFIGVVAFCIALFLLPGDNKKLVQRKGLLLLNGILCFICSSLTAVSFGATFYKYSSDIKEVCSLLKSDYICQSYTPGVEIILLGLAVGLFCISSMYCILFALSLNTRLSGSCKTQYTNNSSRSYFPYAEEIMENQSYTDMSEKQNNITPTLDESATVWNINKERLSLRPPPPQQQRCRSSSDNNNSPLKVHERAANIIDSNADPLSVKPPLVTTSSSLATSTLTASTKDIKFTSSTSLNEDVLRPPVLPFANSNGRSTYHKNNRPLSYDSSNTFGAFCNSGPNSPSGDDASLNSVSSYMDHHSNYQRSGSVTSHSNNSHLMYATSATGGAQSNHTLGTFPLHNAMTRAGSESYVLYNSSFDEEEENVPSIPTSIKNVSTNSLTDDTASNDNSTNIPNQSSSSKPKKAELHKRINDYLSKK
ncbi:unnamed protein product [Mucor hiemalis]